MSTDTSNRIEQLVEIAKALGAILGLPLALFAVMNSVVAHPTISILVAMVTAFLISIWVVSTKWTGIKEVVIAWLSLIVIVLAGFVVWPRTMTVEGIISNTENNPVGNLEVILLDYSGRRYETKTNAEGYYQFKDVPTGSYTIRARNSEVKGET